MLRTICGVINDSGYWRRRYNFDHYKLFRDVNVLKFIKLNKMRWTGHILRMERDRAYLKVFTIVLFGQRPKGRPKKR